MASQDTSAATNGGERGPTPFIEVASPALIAQTSFLLDSYRRTFGRKLLEEHLDPEMRGDEDDDTFSLARESRAKSLYEAPFVVLSHGLEESPLFNYANAQAQELFGLSWAEFVGRPSRRSAEPERQQDRQELLDSVAAQGYVTGYTGVRVTASGARFKIIDGTIWNLTDEQAKPVGQAARFARWELL